MSSTKNEFLARLNEQAENLTKSEQKIADYMVRNHPHSLLLNASALAAKARVNVSTVVRFFTKLGYQGARDAQDEFRSQADFIMKSALDIYHEHTRDEDIRNATLKRVLELELSNISNTLGSVDEAELHQVTSMMADPAVALFIVGDRKQLGLAYYLYSQLNAARRDVFFVTPASAPDHLLNFRQGDLLVTFDFRRYPSINKKTAGLAKQKGGKVVSLVDSPIAPVAIHTDYLFVTHTKNASAFDSYTGALALLNVLVAIVVDGMGKEFEERYTKMLAIYSQLGSFEYQ